MPTAPRFSDIEEDAKNSEGLDVKSAASGAVALWTTVVGGGEGEGAAVEFGSTTHGREHDLDTGALDADVDKADVEGDSRGIEREGVLRNDSTGGISDSNSSGSSGAEELDSANTAAAVDPAIIPGNTKPGVKITTSDESSSSNDCGGGSNADKTIARNTSAQVDMTAKKNGGKNSQPPRGPAGRFFGMIKAGVGGKRKAEAAAAAVEAAVKEEQAAATAAAAAAAAAAAEVEARKKKNKETALGEDGLPDWSVLTTKIGGLKEEMHTFEASCFVENDDTDTQVTAGSNVVFYCSSSCCCNIIVASRQSRVRQWDVTPR